ncbi:hypothetical protein DJ568_05560 [Mucilaginibacter hurinus]|uniref:Cadherin domain-containing protein n=1 Tax=Mucilaginibacter hurinus TaxID=2201324 RepID=A0A367GRX9_9SPHI|nr:YCF48-related protein [Mucilaginibacter hurinus]RCH56202.1 hypothetical protein DJ568_05560 [Mucilaginibacter hurinus]
MLKKTILLCAMVCLLQTEVLQAQVLLKTLLTTETFSTGKLGNNLLFLSRDEFNAGLWRSDGTPQGTTLVKPLNINSSSTGVEMFTFKDHVYFPGYDDVTGPVIWKSDGTFAGTVKLKSFSRNSGLPRHFTLYKGNLIFAAYEGGGNSASIWKTDGTSAGTIKVSPANNGAINKLIVAGNYLYILYENHVLQRTDGTSAGTKTIKLTNDNNYYITNLLSWNGKLVFVSCDGGDWTSQQNIKIYALSPGSTTAVLLKEYKAANYGQLYINNFTAAGDNFYFAMQSYDGNYTGTDAIWKSDGTTAGTQQVKTFSWDRYTSNSNSQNFTWYNNKMYFSAARNYEFWGTDGTETGTAKIGNVFLRPGQKPVVVGNKMYMIAAQAYYYNPARLYSYDGSSDPAVDIDMPDNPDKMFEANGIVYVTSQKRDQYYRYYELWANTPSPLIELTVGYTMANTGTVVNFNSLADSVALMQVTIKNRGKNELKLHEISVSGAPFYLGGQPDQVLAPGNQTSLRLAYLTGRVGQTKGTFNIKSINNPNANITVNLVGNAAGVAQKGMHLPAGDLLKIINFTEDIPLFKLSNKAVNENMPVGTVVGSFPSTSAADKYKFEMIAGSGDSDNNSFKIENGQLKTNAIFDFENKSVYTIRVQGSNSAASLQKSFVITVTDAQENTAPADCSYPYRRATNALLDVAYVGRRLVAVGDNNTIVFSDDDGNTWQKTNVNNSYAAIQAIDSKIAYMYAAGRMLKTEDGAATWFPVEVPQPTSGQNFTRMYFYNASIGYLLGDYGFYKTTDGGVNWQFYSAYVNSSFTLYCAYFSDENDGFVGGSNGKLLRTKDGGKTWQNIVLPGFDDYSYGVSVSAITFVSKSLGFVATNRGIYRTTDGGTTWGKISEMQSSVKRLYFIDKNYGVILIENGGMYLTTDGGFTWNMQNDGRPANGFAINATRNKFCLVSGISAYRAMSQDIFLKKGVSGPWLHRSQYYSGNGFVSSNFIDDNNWYRFGTSSYKTIDGGLTWQQVLIPNQSNPFNITGSFFFDKDNGVVSSNKGVHVTADGGQNWALHKLSGANNPAGLHFIDAQTGFFKSDSYLYRTADGGKSWEKLRGIGGMGNTLAFSFINDKTGFFVAGSGTVYKTKDKGLTWESKGTSYYLNAIHFFDELNGLVGGNDGKLLKTKDGGRTWNLVETQLYSQNIRDLKFLDRLHGYMVADRMYETFDGGNTWKDFFLAESVLSVSINPGKVYFTDNNGVIYEDGTKITPANAGYIKGETYVEVNQKTDYHMPVEYNTYYKWTISGNPFVQYGTNSVTVAWKKAGKYTVEATPYTNCGLGKSRTIEVTVESLPAPQITGPAVVESFSKSEYYTPDNGNKYHWTLPGNNNTAADGNKFTVIWAQPDTAVIQVIETHQQLNIKKSASLTVIIQAPKNAGNNKHVPTAPGTAANGEVVSVYPNPFADKVNISLPETAGIAGGAEVTITRLNGGTVFTREYAAGSGVISVDMAGQDNGIYILTLTRGKTVSSYKIIKN